VQLDTTDVHCVGSKLRFFESVAGSSGLRTRIQLVGLSATMGNVKQLADWLGAELFCTSFRPVPLVEHVVAGNSVIELGDNGKVIRAETAPPSIPGSSAVSDPDRMMSLTARALQRGQQVLIFCPTKASCSHTCKAISESLHLFWRKTLPASMLSKRRSSEMETGSLEELPFLSHHPSPSPVQVQQLRAAREIGGVAAEGGWTGLSSLPSLSSRRSRSHGSRLPPRGIGQRGESSRGIGLSERIDQRLGR
jgi:hypothetical protein